jgi:hypothetical protein
MQLIACNAWAWDASIAQDISNELWIDIVTPTWYVE